LVGTTVDSDAWIRRFHPGPDGVPRLVCFPHAGGSASFFYPVSQALGPGVEVLALQYPGRQERRKEEPLREIHALADVLTDVLRPWTDRPFAFFGHSMGAILAYEVALRLGQEDTAPVVLFASGRRAPSTHRVETVHQRDDDGVVRELKKLAGTEAALLADEELLRMILPAIRADYTAIETYAPRPGQRLSCPVQVLIGDSDPAVTLAEAQQWEDHTTGPLELRSFTGGHFYLTGHQREINALIRDRLTTAR
jgi:pyochelin biosynthesis protein PchC